MRNRKTIRGLAWEVQHWNNRWSRKKKCEQLHTKGQKAKTVGE